MNTVHNNGTHCSIISVIRKGYEILRRFIIKKPIESDDDGTIPAVPDISHDSDFISIIESQPDYVFDVRSGRTNFSSQLINCVDNRQSDDDSLIISDMEIGIKMSRGWKNTRSNGGRIKVE
uniref:Uncharacterized protein n=1 Tax=Onchocerca volvulus TaxID=6282 RepID=A0A8R1XZF4_ONCVO